MATCGSKNAAIFTSYGNGGKITIVEVEELVHLVPSLPRRPSSRSFCAKIFQGKNYKNDIEFLKLKE